MLNIEQEIREIHRKLDMLLGVKTTTPQPAPKGSFIDRLNAAQASLDAKLAKRRAK